MFGEKWLRLFGAVVLIGLMMLPFAYCLEASEVYDINDRQTKDLKSFINIQFDNAETQIQNTTETIVKTFDQRMTDLTKNFAIQATIMMFFAILLANSISIMLRQRHERKLMEFRYNTLLAKEIEVRQREWELEQKIIQQAAESRAAKSESIPPQDTGIEPIPIKENLIKKPQKRGLFGIFGKEKKTSEQDDIDRAMRGAM